MKLFIGGFQIELDSKTKIAQTKQANDLSSLNTRQTNYTNRFKVPVTASNRKAFNYLGIINSNSLAPYIKSDAYLYSDSGECYIYNGYAVITSTGKDYNINIYDGNIDLYKQIENLNLSSLDLSEISHTKDLATVTNSFTSDLDYKYIVADYNGKALYDTDKINIDYLVPSVKVSYLWDKIFNTFGFTYSGSVFNTIDFTNLWMTFPKGVLSTVPDVALYESDDMLFPQNGDIFNDTPNTKNSLYLTQVTNTTNDLQQIYEDTHFKITDTGNYRVEVSGTVKPRGKSIVFGDSSLYPVQCDLWLAKNSENLESDDVTLIKLLRAGVGSDTDNNAYPLDSNEVLELQADDSLCVVLVRSGNPYRNLLYCAEQTDIELTISKVESEIIDFENAFINFKIKDFFNEVLFRYGITPYKDKYTSNYDFLTMQELLQTSNVVDWSASNNKFSEKISESYVYGNYAQQNIFKHKYNDSNDDYFDGNISISNENLNESKTVIASKIYVPENTISNVFEKATNIYKLWDKEPKDDGTTDYKSLSKRFYFLRYEDYYFSSATTIGSEQLQDDTVIYSAPFESFFELSYTDAIQNYYNPLSQVLNKSKVYKAKVFLNELDITNIDFKALYYVKELGGYNMINKIGNFVKKGLTDVEFIKVDYVATPQQEVDNSIITNIYLHYTVNGDYKVRIFYKKDLFIDPPLEYVLDGGLPVTINPNLGIVHLTLPANIPQQEHTFYLQDSGLTSETVTFLT